jgi:hypothetical protein
MELLFKTGTPIKLKKLILNSIEEGDIKTWEIDKSDNKKHIFHTSQWREKGVIEMEVDSVKKQLIVRIIPYDEFKDILKDFEGYYLGRFCEIIFVNFPNLFNSIEKQ